MEVLKKREEIMSFENKYGKAHGSGCLARAVAASSPVALVPGVDDALVVSIM